MNSLHGSGSIHAARDIMMQEIQSEDHGEQSTTTPSVKKTKNDQMIQLLVTSCPRVTCQNEDHLTSSLLNGKVRMRIRLDYLQS